MSRILAPLNWLNHYYLKQSTTVYTVLVPTVGGLVVGFLVYYGAPEAKGRGVPEVMQAVAVAHGRIRALLWVAVPPPVPCSRSRY